MLDMCFVYNNYPILSSYTDSFTANQMRLFVILLFSGRVSYLY